MKQISVAVDGKNDSLSTAMVNKKDVKPLGTVTITMYAPTEDIELKVTPIKRHTLAIALCTLSTWAMKLID